MFTRRDVLKGMMLAGGFCLMPFGKRGWVLAAPQATDRHLVVIFMRGAVDGLSLVTPYREPDYYRKRSTIALPPPGQADGLIDLDGFFGLHPALAPLMPWWQNRTLAFIHASGSPSETRSHFEAQDVMETAMLNTALATQGWMNGLAQALPDNHSPTRALSFGNVLPKIFQGKYDVAAIPVGIQAGGGNAVSNPRLEQAFSRLYGTTPALNGLYKQAVAARAGVMQDLQSGQDLQKEMEASANGAPGADGFAAETAKAAGMMRQDPNIQLLFMDVGGWDTHVQQGNARGQLANKLGKLGDGIAALAEGLGPAFDNTAILIVSEFGRTVAENGNAGTDHGHGNVAWLLGGGVKGGKVWGSWPGLGEDRLYQGRDLAVTTDFRALVGAVIAGHFGLDDRHIGAIIPEYARDPALGGLSA
jgi:X-X-X-Leu-X-X-Gly heptad repeat protein